MQLMTWHKVNEGNGFGGWSAKVVEHLFPNDSSSVANQSAEDRRSIDRLNHLLVVLDRLFKLAEKYVRIAKIALSSSFGRFVLHFASNGESLSMRLDSSSELSEQIQSVADVTVSASLSRSIGHLFHQLQIELIVDDRLLQAFADLVRQLVRLVSSAFGQKFAFSVKHVRCSITFQIDRSKDKQKRNKSYVQLRSP
jgi:hypothetical protein